MAGMGYGIEQMAGVLLTGCSKQGFGAVLLHDSSLVHDGNRICSLLNHGQIMGDKQDRHVEFLLDILDQIKYLGLDGHIQGCCGLIGNEQAGTASQGHGDHYPLPLAAGQLVRVRVDPVFRVFDSCTFEQDNSTFSGLFSGHVPVQHQGFNQLVADCIYRIQRGHGFLKDHGNIIAADSPDLFFV